MTDVESRLSERLNSNLRQIGTRQSAEGTLCVPIGFTNSILCQISFSHLFDFSVESPPTLEVLFKSKKRLLEQLVSASDRMNTCWCTLEEYILLGAQIVDLYYQPYFPINNLYANVFPFNYSVGGERDELLAYYDAPDEIAHIGEHLGKSLEVFENWYGGLAEFDDCLYVSYKSLPSDLSPLIADAISLPIGGRAGDGYGVEITSEERSLLPFIHSVVQQTIESSRIAIILTPELAAIGHDKRLNALSMVASPTYSLTYCSKNIHQPQTGAMEDISRILEKYWGYKEFRDIRVYVDLDSHNAAKATRSVSQSEIIQAIIEQAEFAQGGSYSRDVFVTAPTGSGKSLIFQIPAIYLAQKYGLMTLVVSPLIGLMNDQVRSLYERNITFAATINSDISPVDKTSIAERVRNGEVSILYLSPETLLSRSDISMLIGDREIGLFVIDEAHIVTTWGKAFRSDYWYLGTYLQRLRKRSRFPVATFTATAIYGGVEDMYVETRDSLNLVNPISYFGFVKRENIEVVIRRKEDEEKVRSDYRTDKYKVLLQTLEHFVKKGKKILVYFPLIGLIKDFVDFMQIYGGPELVGLTGKYFGPMNRFEKKDAYDRYRDNRLKIMLATKAFGMGIDIPDIDIVYHFAPTGNVCDYIQEIGRAARQIPAGQARFDFFRSDFSHVNRLHGISTLRKYHLVRTVSKILEIAKSSQNKRNFLVNADEFHSIFSSGELSFEDDTDNKVKTALLILEKDFILKYGYSPIIARPRSLFTHEIFSVAEGSSIDALGPFAQYFQSIDHTEGFKGGSVCRGNLKELWQEHFGQMSFAQFKFRFYSQSNELSIPGRSILMPLMILRAEFATSAPNAKRFLESRIDSISRALGSFTNPNSHFTIAELAGRIREIDPQVGTSATVLAESILDGIMDYSRLQKKGKNFFAWIVSRIENTGKFQMMSGGYQDFFRRVTWALNKILDAPSASPGSHEIYIDKADSAAILEWYVHLGVLEALGILLYRALGGENPEIFIRINSLLP